MNRWIRILILVLVVSAVIYSVNFLTPSLTPQTYTGKEVFQNEEDYNQFKAELSRSEITITKLYVLSSALPRVVSFGVVVPRNIDFPYGQTNKVEPFLFGFMSAVILTLLIFMLSSFWFPRREPSGNAR